MVTSAVVLFGSFDSFDFYLLYLSAETLAAAVVGGVLWRGWRR